MESHSDGRQGNWKEKQKGKTVRRGGISMQSAKVGCATEGGRSGLDDVELQPGFVDKIWYVISAPILDYLEKMIFTTLIYVMNPII